MSVAVKWTGPGGDGTRTFFLCVKIPADKPKTDEWSEAEADAFTSDAAAEAVCKALLIPRAHFICCAYPAHIKRPDKPNPKGAKQYGSYTPKRSAVS